MKVNNSLGCGKGFKIFNSKCVRTDKNPDFICGVADGWGCERLCFKCDTNLKEVWKKEDNLRELKGGVKNNDN